MKCHCGCGRGLTAGRRRWASEACRNRARDRGKTEVGLPAELSAVAKLLADAGVTPDDIGRVEKVKLSEWEGFSKDENGEAVVTPLKGTSVVLSPKWENGPAWPLVEPAKPTLVRPAKPTRSKTKWKTAVVLPDAQVGYRRLKDGRLDPFHDEAAMSVAMKLVAQLQPDLIVNLGDLLDFPQFGTYVQEPAFALTTQAGLDRAHLFLAEQRAASPKAEIKLMEGNHDVRLTRSIISNAAAAFGIQQANAPQSWPVMSVPHLLRLDELEVDYVSGYPNGQVWVNDRLVCKHGPAKLRSSGSSAAASIDDERVSVICGHIHRIEMQHKTRNVRDGYKQNLVASVGCLCRIDGAVPSAKGSIDVMGAPVKNFEDWQHAVGVVSYMEGDGDFSLEVVPIIEGRAIFRGSLVA